LLPERVTSHPVLLRLFTPADAPRVQALLAEAEVAEPTASIPRPYPPGAAAAWIASHDADRERGAVHLRDCQRRQRDLDRRHRTAAAWPTSREHRLLDRPPYWGRGYATAATMAITALAFGYLDCETLAVSHPSTIRRRGASLKMRFRSHSQTRASRADRSVRVHGITRDAWELRIGGSPGIEIPAEDPRRNGRNRRSEVRRRRRKERGRQPARGASRRKSRAV
jgi:hypothetical protein